MSLPRHKQHTIRHPLDAQGVDEIDANFNTVYQDLSLLGQRFQWGTDAPETLVAAPVGTVYLRTGDAAGPRWYLKASRSDETGWTTDLTLAATGRIYLDGGGDTYITERATNTLAVYAGGNRLVDINATEMYLYGPFVMSATKQLYLDGGGNTYIVESSADVISIYAGGANISDFTQSYLNHKGDLYIPATKKVYFDGGTHTYVAETSADVISLVAGGTTSLTVTASGIAISGQTVSFGANDSGGAGYRTVLVPNS